MLAKMWKKIGLIILIIACVFNIMVKLVQKVSLNDELLGSARFMYQQYLNEKQNQTQSK